MDKKRLAEIIFEARSRGKRSQAQFARDIGVSTNTLRNWELADSEPTVDNLKAIADATGRNLIQLVTEITGIEPEALPEPKKAEDVMAIASKLDKPEQFRLIQFLVAQMALHAGVDLEE